MILIASVSASAQDAVKLSGFWVQPVTVHSIEGGQVRYETGSGAEVVRPLDELEGLKLANYPVLSQAQDAIDRGDDPSAVDLLRRVVEQDPQPWVREYVDGLRVQAYTRLDDADGAAAVYIDLVTSDADWIYIFAPPVEPVRFAEAAVKKRVKALASAAMQTVGPKRQALLQRLIDAAGDTAADGSKAGALAEEKQVSGSDVMVLLSASVPPGPIVGMIRTGRFEQALYAAEQARDRPGKAASMLYLKGMAQLALAQRDDDEAGYKSAGLSFMRVRVYFPQSAVVGPAMLEAGYVHQMIGRPDIAKRLYGEARSLIDPREDPAYYQRLDELAGGDPTDATDDD